jgi:hypothetical protein
MPIPGLDYTDEQLFKTLNGALVAWALLAIAPPPLCLWSPLLLSPTPLYMLR